MEQQPNKYHISDDGKIFQIQKDGSITEKGQIDVLLNQSTLNPKSNVKYFLSKNYVWLCVFGGVLLALLISVFGEERFHRYDFAASIHVFFFDSSCWIYLLALCCVFGSWVMHKKQDKQKVWIYVVYAIGLFFMTGGDHYVDPQVWGDLSEFVFWINYLLPAITFAIWAYALQNNKNK